MMFCNSMDVFHVRLAAAIAAPLPPVDADYGTFGEAVGNVMTEVYNDWGIDPYDYYPNPVGGAALGLEVVEPW